MMKIIKHKVSTLNIASPCSGLCVYLVLLLVAIQLPAAGSMAPVLLLRSQAQHGGGQQWQMNRCQDVSADGAVISLPGFGTAAWREAVVPGTVLNGQKPGDVAGMWNGKHFLPMTLAWQRIRTKKPLADEGTI